MQLRLYAAFILFLGSYLPLSVILLAQNFRYDLIGGRPCTLWRDAHCFFPIHQPIAGLAFFGVCCACFLFTVITLAKISPRQDKVIKEAKPIPADLMNYVLPYIVSFMGLNYDEVGKFVGFLVFLLWIFLITYKSERIIMNPVLAVFGWKLYDVTYHAPAGNVDSATVALSQVELISGGTHKVSAIQQVLVIKT